MTVARHVSLAVTLVVVLFTVWQTPAHAGDYGSWAPVATIRFGNADAVDADDGNLAGFLKSIRNDGRFIPPLRSLIGPQIRNPTFFGLTFEGWIEAVLLAPPLPGGLETVWLFPVDSRDEYLAQMASTGLSEYEGMDGTTVLRETGSDGGVTLWYLEWLPGNVVVFGRNRAAVAAAQLVYREYGASRGLLSGTGGGVVEPDFMIRLEPTRFVAWQDRESGRYWWRDMIQRLVVDLEEYWQPATARRRLIDALAGELMEWPRTLGALDASFWFEPDGVEWTATVRRSGKARPRSQLPILRRMPPRAALAYAIPVSAESFSDYAAWAGRLMLGAAGGVVTRDTRDIGRGAVERLMAARPRELASGWILPPPGNPELGAARILLCDWQSPESLDAAWSYIDAALQPGGPLQQTAAQIGWDVSITEMDGAPGAFVLRIGRYDDASSPPFYDGLLCIKRQGGLVALVTGPGREDLSERERLARYRLTLAAEAVTGNSEGTPDIRSAFVRMGSGGSSLLGVIDPLRFVQLALIEAADWRPRTPDQPEPLSTQLAREMLEQGQAGPWTIEGTVGEDGIRINGALPWRSLSRLAAALGITESMALGD